MQNEMPAHMLEETPLDYFEGMQELASQSVDKMERLTQLVKQSRAKQIEVGELEVKLAEAQEELKKINRVEIPDLMKLLQIKEYKLTTGEALSISSKTNASVSEHNRPAFFAWLEKTDNDGIIKTNVSVQFGKGEMEKAREAAALLGNNKFLANLERSVHHQTLQSFVKEQIEKGNQLPPEVHVFEFDEAKIVAPKAKKKK